MTRSMFLLRSSFVIVLTGLLTASQSGAAPPPPDLDRDGVEDAVDNCMASPNGHQEDTNDIYGGDVCDRTTINPIMETTVGKKGVNAFHVSTPYQRVRIFDDGGLAIAFSAESGTFTDPPLGGIGVKGADDSGVILLTPQSGIPGTTNPAYRLNTRPTMLQSTWQSLVVPDLHEGRGKPPIRFHAASSANGVGLGFEIPLSVVAAGSDVEVQLALELPPGLCLDTSEVTAGGGVGRLTITDCAGNEKIRLSAVDLVSFGSETKLEDTPEFFGLQRLTAELNDEQSTAGAGPPDLVGGNFYKGIEADLVQASYTLKEDRADSAIGRTRVVQTGPSTFVISLIADASFAARNSGSSSLMGIGLRVSSLTPVDFGTGETVYGRHIVGFDEEAGVSGVDVLVKLENSLGTFDGQPTDYSLQPNNGGTAAIEKWAEQQQTAFGCAGCQMALMGDSTIQFADIPSDPNGVCPVDDGGAGVGIGPGARVGPAHPCLSPEGGDPLDTTTQTGRCAVGLGIRGSFVANKLTIEGSMSGLVAAESDVQVDELIFIQKHDPNVTDEIALHAALGLGCAADSGIRISRNPADGRIVSNGPLDFNACTCGSEIRSCSPDEVGEGLCLPAPLSSPPGTGICNLVVKRVELMGMGAAQACQNLMVPSGVGVALGMRAGRGEIGSKSFNPQSGNCETAGIGADPSPSRIEGFEVAIATSGGANVNAATGASLRFDDPDAVPPNHYCLDKFDANDNEVGVAVGANVDVSLSRCNVARTQFGAIHVGNGAANVATPATTACTELDGACRTVAQELACPSCALGKKNFLAVSGAGKSAPTRLAVKQCVLGLDEQGMVSSGMNDALPDLEINPDLTAQNLGLTIASRQASLFGTPIQVAKGADTINAPGLLTIIVETSNVGVQVASTQLVGAAISFDNRDSVNSDQSNVSAANNCFSLGDGTCESEEAVMVTAEADPEVIALNSDTLDQASPLLKPAGGDVESPFHCYSSEPRGTPLPEENVMIDDPFFGQSSDTTILRSLEFCSPVNKDGEGIKTPDASLHCYEVREDATPSVQMIVSTQFGTHDLEAVRAQSLCFPAILGAGDTSPVEALVDHFKCYQRSSDPGLEPQQVGLEDDFDAKLHTVKLKPTLVCNPVSVDGSDVVNPDDHLACYALSDVEGEPTFEPLVGVTISDGAFGTSDIDVVKSRLLCERATAQLVL